jgi:hypothetical protein
MQRTVAHGLLFLSKQMQHSVSVSMTIEFNEFNAIGGSVWMCMHMQNKNIMHKLQPTNMPSVCIVRTVMPSGHIENSLVASS